MKWSMMCGALWLAIAGSAWADLPFFGDGNSWGGNQRHHAATGQQGTAYGDSRAAGDSKGHARGRGEADINMDFLLNMRMQGLTQADTDSSSRGNWFGNMFHNYQADGNNQGYGNAFSTWNTWAYPGQMPQDYSSFYQWFTPLAGGNAPMQSYFWSYPNTTSMPMQMYYWNYPAGSAAPQMYFWSYPPPSPASPTR